MKACPGLRSGIDRSGSLSFAIRGIPSSIRPPNRHSGDRRHAPYPDTGAGIQKGWGGVRPTRRWKKPTRHPIFILLCGLRRAMVIPAIEEHALYPDTGRESRGGAAGAPVPH